MRKSLKGMSIDEVERVEQAASLFWTFVSDIWGFNKE